MNNEENVDTAGILWLSCKIWLPGMNLILTQNQSFRLICGFFSQYIHVSKFVLQLFFDPVSSLFPATTLKYADTMLCHPVHIIMLGMIINKK